MDNVSIGHVLNLVELLTDAGLLIAINCVRFSQQGPFPPASSAVHRKPRLLNITYILLVFVTALFCPLIAR